jgi:hypothetical protein
MRTLAIGIVLALARAVPSAGSLIATAAEANDQTKRIDHDVRLQNAGKKVRGPEGQRGPLPQHMIEDTSAPQPERPDPFAFHSAGCQSPIAGLVSVDEIGIS